MDFYFPLSTVKLFHEIMLGTDRKVERRNDYFQAQYVGDKAERMALVEPPNNKFDISHGMVHCQWSLRMSIITLHGTVVVSCTQISTVHMHVCK